MFNYSAECKNTPLLLCIGQNLWFFVKNFSYKTARKPSVYKALSDFCVIRTRASTRRTIPVAFIYLSPFPVGNDLCVVPVVFPFGNGTQAIPYNSFTNYAVRICKETEIIPHFFSLHSRTHKRRKPRRTSFADRKPQPWA